MTEYAAFGNESVKQTLIEDIGASGPVYQSWLTHAAFEGDLTPVTRDFHLHPAYARLLPGLGDYGQTSESVTFYLAALNALPVGADSGHLARQFLPLAWEHPEFGLARTVAPSPLRDAAEAIVALVRTSLNRPVERKEWRVARSRLAREMEAAGGTDAIDLVMSMAWDLEEVPGAAQDVITSWSGIVFFAAQAGLADQFSQADQERFQAGFSAFHQQALGEAGEMKPGDAEAYGRYQDALARLWRSDPELEALKSRRDTQSAEVRTKVAIWRAAVQQCLLDLSTDVPVLAHG